MESGWISVMANRGGFMGLVLEAPLVKDDDETILITQTRRTTPQGNVSLRAIWQIPPLLNEVEMILTEQVLLYICVLNGVAINLWVHLWQIVK